MPLPRRSQARWESPYLPQCVFAWHVKEINSLLADRGTVAGAVPSEFRQRMWTVD